MKISFVYATHRGPASQFAERIAAPLDRRGIGVIEVPADQARGVGTFDAVPVGSALHCGGLKRAVALVWRNRVTPIDRLGWRFSSGPTGSSTTDAGGRNVRSSAAPGRMTEMGQAVHARGHGGFFGTHDPRATSVGFLERSLARAQRQPPA